LRLLDLHHNAELSPEPLLLKRLALPVLPGYVLSQRRVLIPPLFPYTTLFRSRHRQRRHLLDRGRPGHRNRHLRSVRLQRSRRCEQAQHTPQLHAAGQAACTASADYDDTSTSSPAATATASATASATATASTPA